MTPGEYSEEVEWWRKSVVGLRERYQDLESKCKDNLTPEDRCRYEKTMISISERIQEILRIPFLAPLKIEFSQPKPTEKEAIPLAD